MNAFRNSLFFKVSAVLFLSVVCFCSNARAGEPVGGSKDSTNTIRSGSIVANMNREQLGTLVDLLFEMDTIPPDLMKEVNKAIAFFNAEDEREEALNAMKPTIPSSDFYSSWEINKLFPEKDMLQLKGDTSVTLTLRGGERGEYFHPFDGPVTSGFGWRDSAQHNGIDIDLNKGDKVAAAFDGMVRIAKREGGFGNVVIIRHYNGLETVYGHLSKLKVKPGQVVVSGQTIGLGGSTGHSTGSHLHFEVRFKGVPINPKYLISFSDEKLLCDEITIRKTKWGLAAYPEGQKCYTIEKGDTIFEIAKRYATTTASIKQMNGFSGKIRLKPGMVINVVQ
ncbi:MAG: peptidoglycan DD-metalloendopeptidase family protein [Bacteroidia bacterium]